MLNRRYPVIFSAPPGWGKTTHAQALMKQYGCTSVVDNWTPGMPLVAGALHLTNVQAKVPPFFSHLRGQEFKLITQGWAK